jgi:hypothetical protein
LFMCDLFNNAVSTALNINVINAAFWQDATRKHLWPNLFISHLPAGLSKTTKSSFSEVSARGNEPESPI